MKRRLNLSLVLFVLASPAWADCTVDGATSDGGNVVNCDTDAPNPETIPIVGTANDDEITVGIGAGMDTAGNRAIDGAGGSDTIRVLGTNGPDDVIDNSDGTGQVIYTSAPGEAVVIEVRGTTLLGNDKGVDVSATGGSTIIDVIDSTITTANQGVNLSAGSQADVVTIVRSTITSTGSRDAVETYGGNDIVTITDSTLTSGSNDEALELGGDDDQVTIVRSTLVASGADAVDGEAGNDIVRIGDEVDLTGLLSGGPDFDELVFQQTVSASDCATLEAELALLDPAGDSITIDGYFFQWEDFEVLTADFACPSVLEVPATSTAGRVGLAALLALLALWVIAHRR